MTETEQEKTMRYLRRTTYEEAENWIRANKGRDDIRLEIENIINLHLNAATGWTVAEFKVEEDRRDCKDVAEEDVVYGILDRLLFVKNRLKWALAFIEFKELWVMMITGRKT